MEMGWMNRFSFALFIALVIQQHRGTDAARILGIFPWQGKSHFIMCETLMKALVARGHHVDVISHFPQVNPPPNYHDISIAGTLQTIVNNLTLADSKMFQNVSPGKVVSFGKNFCNLLELPQFQKIIRNPPTDPPYDLVIYEHFLSDCYLAFGRHLKVPVVSVVTTRMFDWINLPMGNPQSASFVPSIFSGFSQRMSFAERLSNTLITSAIKVQHWWFITEQIPYVEKYFGIKISDMNELYKDVAALLVNTHPSFDFIKPSTPGIIEVGGLHVTDGDQDFPPEVKKWLDRSKDGFIYFSFGSMVKIESFTAGTIKAFYTAFEQIAPVRVLMKIAKKDALPPGLPKNVMTYPWLPQTRVLQHKNVKAFVTHGGLGSTHEAITYGVPMVHVPLFGDQKLTARLCDERNISVTVDYRTVTSNGFTRALRTILNTPSYSENAKRLSKLFIDRPMSALDTATFWVEYVIRNGNILRSPAAELSWWQLELLDVYGFIVMVILGVLYIVKRMLGFIIYLLCSKSGNQKGAPSASKLKKNK